MKVSGMKIEPNLANLIHSRAASGVELSSQIAYPKAQKATDPENAINHLFVPVLLFFKKTSTHTDKLATKFTIDETT